MEGRTYRFYLTHNYFVYKEDNGRQNPIFIIFTKQTIGELKKLCLIQFKNGKQVLTELTSNHKAISKRLI